MFQQPLISWNSLVILAISTIRLSHNLKNIYNYIKHPFQWENFVTSVRDFLHARRFVQQKRRCFVNFCCAGTCALHISINGPMFGFKNCLPSQIEGHTTPQKSNIDTKQDHILSRSPPFPNHHFGALQPFVFRDAMKITGVESHRGPELQVGKNNIISLVVEPNIWKMFVKLDHETPRFGVKIPKISLKPPSWIFTNTNLQAILLRWNLV